MTATILRLPVPDACRFSTVESAVLWRLQDGEQIATIALELGLAGPIVKEYIKAILRKGRPGGIHLSAALGRDEQTQSTLCHDLDRPIRAGPTIEEPL
jgi:DNA-binding CsgD family transcriptional regulator